MKLFIKFAITISLLSGISKAWAQTTYSDGASYDSDPVWGGAYWRYSDGGDDVVTSGTELIAAINATGTYNATKPYIIPIANDITISAAISLSNKNIVLRKVTRQDIQPSFGSYYQATDNKYIVQKYWDYNDPWFDTNATSPELYDGEPDFGITVTDINSHFTMSGAENSLTTENITLYGRNTYLNLTGKSPLQGGGIYISSNQKITLACNIAGVGAESNTASNNRHSAVGIYSGTSGNIQSITFRGGVIWHNHAGAFGGAAFHWNGGTTGSIVFKGYTIIEDNYSESEGGAFYKNGTGASLDIIDNVIFRNNTGGDGGALHMQGGITVNLRNNVLFEGNRTLSRPKVAVLFPSNGGAIWIAQYASSSTEIVNIYDNVTFRNNQAARGGGAIAMGNSSSQGPGTLTLYGGRFENNSALGLARDLGSLGSYSVADQYAIGGGGAIYAYKTTEIKIPPTSTVHFEGNYASVASYLDNTSLQQKTTGNSFYANDDYISHIQNPNVHTSLINVHGQTGWDYYNLYNNYDIGTPNNIPNDLYAIVNLSLSPADGRGGSIVGDINNHLYDILGDGHMWAESNQATPLSYTAVPVAGYEFSGWQVTSSNNILLSEKATLLGLASSATQAQIDAELVKPVLKLKVSSFDIYLEARFVKQAVLSITPPSFDILALDETEDIADVTPWYAAQPFSVSNLGEMDAVITGVELVGTDAGKFTLTGSTTGTIAAGQTDETKWTLAPDQEQIPNPSLLNTGEFISYAATFRITYSGGKTAEVPVIFHLIRKPGIIITGEYHFDTHVKGSPSVIQPVSLHNYGVINGQITVIAVASAVNISTGEFTVDDSGVFEVGKNAVFNVSATVEESIANGVDKNDWLVRLTSPMGDVIPGDYERWLVVKYISTDNPLDIRMTTVPITVSVINPAEVSFDETRMAANLDDLDDDGEEDIVFTGVYKEGYPLSPSDVTIAMLNFGQVSAVIETVYMENEAASVFEIRDKEVGKYIPPYADSNAGLNTNYAVHVKTGLTQGSYSDFVIVKYQDGTDTQKTLRINVIFEVEAADIWNFTLSGTNHTFDNAGAGYSEVSPQTVTINNTGNRSSEKMIIEFVNPTSDFILSTETIDNIASGGTGTFTVRPSLGLPTGTYTAQIRVKYDMTDIVDDTSDNNDEYSQKNNNFHFYIVSFTVESVIPSIEGDASVCKDDTGVTYTTESGQKNYDWRVSSGGEITAGLGTNEITVTWSGASQIDNLVRVRYCPGSSDQYTSFTRYEVEIKQAPTVGNISVESMYCAGGTLNLYPPEVTTHGSSVSDGNKVWKLDNEEIEMPYMLNVSDNGKTLKYVVTSECGQESFSGVTLDVRTVPSIAAITAPTGVCNNTSLTLTAPMTTSSPAFTSQGWKLDAGNFTSGYAVTYDQNDKDLYYEAANVCGTNKSNTVQITVYPTPVPSFVSGADEAAPGQGGMVYTTQSGMTDYVWGITNGAITSGGNGNNTATVTWDTEETGGSISVTYKSAAGCPAASPATQPVNFEPQTNPTIGGTTTVCPTSNNEYTYTTEKNKFDYAWTITGGAAVTATDSGDGYPTIKVTWTSGGTGEVSVSYRHTNDAGLPLVSKDKDITKQTVTSITTQPLGGTDCFGGSVSLSVAVSCQDNTATYQWKKGGENVGVASSNPGYPATESGAYTVEVSGICGTVTSSPAVTVTIKDKPAATLTDITSAYTTQEVTYTTDGGSVGDAGTYNWDYTGATLVSGGTGTDKTITVKWTTTGTKTISVDYTVDGCPTTTATKNVTVVAQGQPIIDDGDPVTSVCFGASQSYATASNKYNYYWTVSGGSVTTGQGTATASITWGGVGNGTVKVEYSEVLAATAVESEETTVTINDQPSIDPITAPAGVCSGSPLTLTALVPEVDATPAASSSGWKLNGSAFTSGSTVTYAQTGQSLVYEATNACGTTSSNTVQIEVFDLPTVTTTEQFICPGTPINLGTVITSSHTLRFYTQLTGGTPLSNLSVTPSVNTSYYVSAEDAHNCLSASREELPVTMKPITAITVQPQLQGVVGLGQPFSLDVTATGSGLSYQWYKGATVATATPLSGEMGDELNVTSTSAADYGIYYVIVSGDCGLPQTSNAVTVDILSPDATLRDLKVNGVTVSGFIPSVMEYTYILPCSTDRVTIEGTTNHAGASFTSLPNAALVPGDNVYNLTVTAENGFTTKTYRLNIIRDCYVPKITKDLEDAIICVNESHTFELGVEGEGLTYEWYYGNSRILGANTNRYTIVHARPTDYEKYYVIVWSNYNGYHASIYSKQVRLWVTEQLPETLQFETYPDPAFTGSTYHLKLAGYSDVTEYAWSYSKEDVTFSPETGVVGENETWATFGTLSEGTGTVTATLTHPCGTREATQTIRVTYPTGTEDVTDSQVAVYPNPTAEVIRISNTVSNQVVRITDVTGSQKWRYRTQEGVTTIDLTGYAKGTYLVHYDGKTYKVIKK